MEIPKVILALPCYNESENIEALIYQCILANTVYGRMFQLQVLIIDDCSKDNTLKIAEVLKSQNKIAIDIIKHAENRGLVGGLNTAFKYFHKKLEDPSVHGFCLMDGDNTHSPLQIFQMLQLLLQGTDVVIASRFRQGSKIVGVAWWRQILSFGMACMFKFLGPICGVRDYSCGFRLYSRDMVQKLRHKWSDQVVVERSFACMVELLVKCDLVGGVCTEVPLILRYDKKGGASKMPFLVTILGTLKVLFKRKQYDLST